jgi:hypothetical protein
MKIHFERICRNTTYKLCGVDPPTPLYVGIYVAETSENAPVLACTGSDHG